MHSIENSVGKWLVKFRHSNPPKPSPWQGEDRGGFTPHLKTRYRIEALTGDRVQRSTPISCNEQN
jgi:hypothetical protein